MMEKVIESHQCFSHPQDNSEQLARNRRNWAQREMLRLQNRKVLQKLSKIEN